MQIIIISFICYRHNTEEIVSSFTQPTELSNLLQHIKSRPCTGFTELGKDRISTADQGYYTGEKSRKHTSSSEPCSGSSYYLGEPSDRTTEDPMSSKCRRCSSKEVCRKQRSGEVCSGIVNCCHLCTGQLGRQSFPVSGQLQSNGSFSHPHPPQSDSQRHSTAFGYRSSDTNSDSDVIQLSDGGWRDVDSEQLLSHLPSLVHPHSIHYDQDQPETDHGGRSAPHGSDKCRKDDAQDTFPEEAFQCSVEETAPRMSRLQELVVSTPLVFSWPPVHRPKEQQLTALSTMQHVYTRPFVCNMPELQPFFVGER